MSYFNQGPFGLSVSCYLLLLQVSLNRLSFLQVIWKIKVIWHELAFVDTQWEYYMALRFLENDNIDKKKHQSQCSKETEQKKLDNICQTYELLQIPVYALSKSLQFNRLLSTFSTTHGWVTLVNFTFFSLYFWTDIILNALKRQSSFSNYGSVRIAGTDISISFDCSGTKSTVLVVEVYLNFRTVSEKRDSSATFI